MLNLLGCRANRRSWWLKVAQQKHKLKASSSLIRNETIRVVQNIDIIVIHQVLQSQQPTARTEDSFVNRNLKTTAYKQVTLSSRFTSLHLRKSYKGTKAKLYQHEAIREVLIRSWSDIEVGRMLFQIMHVMGPRSCKSKGTVEQMQAYTNYNYLASAWVY